MRLFVIQQSVQWRTNWVVLCRLTASNCCYRRAGVPKSVLFRFFSIKKWYAVCFQFVVALRLSQPNNFADRQHVRTRNRRLHRSTQECRDRLWSTRVQRIPTKNATCMYRWSRRVWGVFFGMHLVKSLHIVSYLQRVAAIKRRDPSPRYVGGSPRRLTPELSDEIREFIEEEHGRISVKIVSNRFTMCRTNSRKAIRLLRLRPLVHPHSAPSGAPSHP